MSYSVLENRTSARLLEEREQRAEDYGRALERAELHIRTAFASYFAGHGKAVLERARPGYHGRLARTEAQFVCDAVDEVLDYEDTLEAYRNLLTGVGTLDEYREALVSRYIKMRADDLAEAWLS